jgi:hypothetical protein
MKKTTLEEKLAIRSGIECGKSYQQIADSLGLTRRVVLKWGQKVKKNASLCPVMGRAKSGLLSSFSPLITEAINIYRPGSEGWSAEVIAVELSLDARFTDIPQPSVSSIHKYLSKRGKSKRQTKHSLLPVSSDIPISTRPHKLWQMDSEGWHRLMAKIQALPRSL